MQYKPVDTLQSAFPHLQSTPAVFAFDPSSTEQIIGGRDVQLPRRQYIPVLEEQSFRPKFAVKLSMYSLCPPPPPTEYSKVTTSPDRALKPWVFDSSTTVEMVAQLCWAIPNCGYIVLTETPARFNTKRIRPFLPPCANERSERGREACIRRK